MRAVSDPELAGRLARVDTLLFDATGTLLSLVGDVGTAYAAAAAEHGLALDAGLARAAFDRALAAAPPLAFPGLSGAERDTAERAWWRGVVRRVVTAADSTPSRAGARLDEQRFEALFADLYRRFARASAWRVGEGVPAILTQLGRRGYQLAVLSNFDSRLLPLLAELGLAGHFSRVFTSSVLGAAKPDVRAFARALALLGSEAARSAHVGDSVDADARGAAAAGLLPVLVGPPLPPNLAGLAVDRPADLLSVFGGPSSPAADGSS